MLMAGRREGTAMNLRTETGDLHVAGPARDPQVTGGFDLAPSAIPEAWYDLVHDLPAARKRLVSSSASSRTFTAM